MGVEMAAALRLRRRRRPIRSSPRCAQARSVKRGPYRQFRHSWPGGDATLGWQRRRADSALCSIGLARRDSSGRDMLLLPGRRGAGRRSKYGRRRRRFRYRSAHAIAGQISRFCLRHRGRSAIDIKGKCINISAPLTYRRFKLYRRLAAHYYATPYGTPLLLKVRRYHAGFTLHAYRASASRDFIAACASDYYAIEHFAHIIRRYLTPLAVIYRAYHGTVSGADFILKARAVRYYTAAST